MVRKLTASKYSSSSGGISVDILLWNGYGVTPSCSLNVVTVISVTFGGRSTPSLVQTTEDSGNPLMVQLMVTDVALMRASVRGDVSRMNGDTTEDNGIEQSTHFIHTCMKTHSTHFTHTCMRTHSTHFTHTCMSTHSTHFTHTCMRTHSTHFTHTCMRTHSTHFAHTCMRTHSTHCNVISTGICQYHLVSISIIMM